MADQQKSQFPTLGKQPKKNADDNWQQSEPGDGLFINDF
jgi:hypothetical protein